MNKEKMRGTGMALAVLLGCTCWLAGCGNGQGEAVAAESAPSADKVEEPSAPSSFVEREFWLALAEEPGWHMNVARESFLDGRSRKASEELEKVAAILNFEVRHSHSSKERGHLLGSIQELREVAKNLRHEEDPGNGPVSLAELDRVSALAFRTLAAHQVTLARDALEAGDARMAGRYIQETVKAILRGFELAEVDPGNAMESRLQVADAVGERLVMDGDGSRELGLESLDHLDGSVEGLSNVLTSRRR